MDYQIILLPKENYYAWVGAAKDYVLRFGPNLTADPDSAGRYMTPQQTVTIAGAPNGYPGQGDIQIWFQKNYPSIQIDYIAVDAPADLAAALKTRLDADDRYLQPDRPFQLLWPTEFPKVTQGFGANPDVYRRWNLPGHEGIDFRAPSNSKVFACADGTVKRVDSWNGNPQDFPYGNRVDVAHRAGYVTLYAHLQQALVKVGETVRAGQVIGLADATGFSSGDHLHLTLKKIGATAAGLTNYPRDIIDPAPFLIWPAEANPGSSASPPAVTLSVPWPAGKCLMGVNGRADGRMQEADFAAVAQARMEAVKLTSTAAPEDVDRLRAINPEMFIMVRLFASFRGRNYPAAQFAQDVQHDMGRFYERGVRYFEVHNEVNLVDEGWTTTWQNGREFGAWFLEVRQRLKAVFPEALFGYPGLSPDGFPMPLRTNDIRFLDESEAAVQAADWIGLHCYWVDEAGLNSPGGGLGYLEYRRRYPNKLLFITEFSNPAQGVDKGLKAQHYARYYQMVRNVPGLGAALAFVLSASSGFPHEVWRDEKGSMSEIPGVLGNRPVG